ncbi:NAD(P)-binding domain-containing protein [Parabacteroides sp. OttesenSCG-928-G07]|nr:NAD(P)-binding domain-containing protein [Parabacteroides sp. OttesenSCG-928-G07]
MNDYSIGFIGGGRIVKIMLKAFVNRYVSLQSVVVFEPNPESRNMLRDEFPFVSFVEDVLHVFEQSILFLALHPPVIKELLESKKLPELSNTIVISLAPKITIDKLSRALSSTNVVRLLPNATSYINKGYNPVVFSNDFDSFQKTYVMGLLKMLGNTFEVEETKLEGYAILSAMLPTYFWFQWDGLVELGKSVGFTEEESREVVKNTLPGAIDLLYDSGLKPEEVMNLIPVKPMEECQQDIMAMYKTKLIDLFNKIHP